MIGTYEHHGNKVFVDLKLQGKHREHCLCFKCERFDIEDRDKNCGVSNLIYDTCVEYGLVTPVYECPAFENKE